MQRTLGDRRITIAAMVLVIFGSMMIASAEMGNSAGDASYLTTIITHQLVFAIVGIVGYFFIIRFKPYRFSMYVYWAVYFIILFLLLSCRLFGERNGAYAWIGIGNSITIQPSEFAKAFIIAFAGKMLGRDYKDGNRQNLIVYGGAAFFYFIIIAFYQHDFGSAIVLFVIAYCMALIPNYKEIRQIQNIMIVLIFVALLLAGVVMSKPFTELLKAHSDNYMIGRFLAAADPFLYQYDNGYHLIMSLVSFANGGIFGLGYGNSIHKYMNFPNPSNDFILPVIVEELGVFGFAILILAYGFLLVPLITNSIKSKSLSTKIILLGVFIYFVIHFILNVGGVSGLIPLTGVPLLLISSGGSSLLASLVSLGLAQSEIIKSKKLENESSSR